MSRLLLDVDGVLADFIQLFLDALLESCGIKKKREDVTDWNIHTALGLDRKQTEATYSLLRMPGRAYSMRVYPGVVEAVQKLTTIADVYFVTSSFGSPTWDYDRTQWLAQHFGAEQGKKVAYTMSGFPKYICSGDVFVDDKPANVNSWGKHNPNGVPVLWSQPYNSKEDTTFIRTDRWVVVERFLKGFRDDSQVS